MAAGDVLVLSDVDRFLNSVLSANLTLANYAPGGCWAETPPQIKDPWASTETYITGDRVKASNGYVYSSLQDANTNHDPATSPTWWKLAYPCVRWWPQSPGRDVRNQQLIRIESTPKFVVTMLDSQPEGYADYVDGTLGAGNLELGAKQIVTLLDHRRSLVNGFDFLLIGLAPYRQREPNDGRMDVMTGYWFEMRIQ